MLHAISLSAKFKNSKIQIWVITINLSQDPIHLFNVYLYVYTIKYNKIKQILK